MIWAIEFNGAFRNDQRRDAVASAVQTRLADFELFGIETITLATKDDHGLHIFARFVSEADRDTFWTDMLAAFGSGINGPVTDSRAAKHTCTHDSPHSGDCVVTDEVIFS